MLYFADAKWWRWHKDRPEFQAFAGIKCSIENTGAQIEDGAIHMLRNGGPEGLSTDPQALRTGQNSGYQAINFALLAGAETVLLLGYDGKVAKDGKTHFFGHHAEREQPYVYDLYRKALRKLPPLLGQEVKVINCSPDSAVDCFPKMDLEQALCWRGT